MALARAWASVGVTSWLGNAAGIWLRGNSCRDFDFAPHQPIGPAYNAHRTDKMNPTASLTSGWWKDHRSLLSPVVRHKSDYLAITKVVQELPSLGKSRFAAVRTSTAGAPPERSDNKDPAAAERLASVAVRHIRHGMTRGNRKDRSREEIVRARSKGVDFRMSAPAGYQIRKRLTRSRPINARLYRGSRRYPHSAHTTTGSQRWEPRHCPNQRFANGDHVGLLQKVSGSPSQYSA